ncbi:MAG TPA: A24 family peptidase [Stellaceae bacterium]|nr:A24 family peptidase [Stellaceae bacterium]
MADFGLLDTGLAVLAPAIGSFLGVVVRRLPDGLPIAWSRSRCESCSAQLQARDLLPLLSWMLSRGRCRHCGSRVGWFYPAIELAALAIALIALCADGTPRALLDCLLGWWLLTLGWIDARRWILPDALTLPLIVAGLFEAALFDPDRLLDRALGAVLGYLLLRGVALGYRALHDRDGLGHGDAKLMAAAGAWVGSMALPQVVLAAALSALVAAGVMRLSERRIDRLSALAFGPFIALATWAVWMVAPIR